MTLAPTSLTSPGYMISPKVKQPDWKITIENSDGSTSEVDLFRREVRISMRGDNSIRIAPNSRTLKTSILPKTCVFPEIKELRCRNLRAAHRNPSSATKGCGC
jgi:hypothetical protein